MFIPLRDENPTRRVPVVTLAFIALNTAVFLFQAFSARGLEYYVLRMGAIPWELSHFTTLARFPVERISPFLALIASMFLHGSLFHLAGNMLYLWIFGNNVEDLLGPIRFIFFYFVSGTAAGLTHVLFNPNSTSPMIGASGAVAGILGAYFLVWPGARVQTLIFFIWVVPVPAAIVLGLWFVGQILNVGLGGGVAWFAHIGGFLAGMGLIALLAGRRFPKRRLSY